MASFELKYCTMTSLQACKQALRLGVRRQGGGGEALLAGKAITTFNPAIVL